MFRTCLLLFAAIVVSQNTAAQSGVSACASDTLKSCKMTNRTVQANSLKEYSKVFNCAKYGSTDGMSFNIGIPIPDGPMLGFDIGSKSEYSSNVCREEIKKVDSTNFFTKFSEVFDQECGNAAAGGYQQCLVTVAKIEAGKAGQPVQSMQCTSIQTGNNLTIGMLYRPAMNEGKDDYKVKDVVAPNGVQCESNVSAGINNAALMSCSLPTGYTAANMLVRLANNVSCNVPILAEHQYELDTVKKYSCSNVFNKIAAADKNGLFTNSLLKAAAIGYCDQCLHSNVSTDSSDRRTLSTRVVSCAGWAVSNLLEGDSMLFCRSSVLQPQSSTSGLVFTPYPEPVFSPDSKMAVAPPGINVKIIMGNPPNMTPKVFQQLRFDAFTLCNDRKPGQVLQITGDTLNKLPSDFVAPRINAISGPGNLLWQIEDALK